MTVEIYVRSCMQYSVIFVESQLIDFKYLCAFRRIRVFNRWRRGNSHGSKAL